MCNKCDTPEKRVTAVQKKFLDQQQIEYFMVSAKMGKGVQEAIMAIAKKMITIVPRAMEKSLSLELRESHFEGGVAKKQKDKKCC